MITKPSGPTAGVAVIYSLFVTMVVHREVGLADLWRIIMSAVFLISQILMIVTAAGLYSWLLTTSGMPQKIVAEINALQLSPWALLLFINVSATHPPRKTAEPASVETLRRRPEPV